MQIYPDDIATKLKLQRIEKEERYYRENKTFVENGIIILEDMTIRDVFHKYDISTRTAFILAKLLAMDKIKNLDAVQKRCDYV